ncbi:MAG: ankyrin repeat domain-containing protein [Planctomycetes bacterium]|nr:ankyrin repeat domain-containing protein [Planctomycetota bacterium]
MAKRKPAAIKPLRGKSSDFSGIVLKAAASGNAAAVRQYLKVNPAWLNQEGPHGRTMLWEAAYKGRTELVRELLKLGSDVAPLGSYYTPMLVEMTPLAMARQAGRTELAELLEANGATDDLYAACHRGDLEAVSEFLTADPEAINRAARPGQDHQWLGFHPIHYAVAGGQQATVKLLVGFGAEVAEHQELLLRWCDWARDKELARYLWQQATGKKSKRKVGRDPTALRGKRKAAKKAVRVPAVDRPDWMGFPPLVEACRGNHNAPDDPERVRKLVERGASINITDHKGKTPLHRASQAGHVNITRLLLKKGAELEATDPTGITPLVEAAHHGRTAVVEILLAEGANLAHLDHRGETPLFAAARGGRDETFAALLAAGADAEMTNKRGHTLAEIVGGARHQTDGRKKILKILKKQ